MVLDGVTFNSSGGGSNSTDSGNTSAPGTDDPTTPGTGGTNGATPGSGSAEGGFAANGVPDKATSTALANVSLTLFKASVDAEDFSAFHAASSEALQKVQTPESIKTAFKVFIDSKSLLDPIAGGNPDVETANVTPEGNLELEGDYAGASPPMKFKLTYVNENGQWKLSGINVRRTS
jgi:hypothetical protein